jgi:hypothetical protein
MRYEFECTKCRKIQEREMSLAQYTDNRGKMVCSDECDGILATVLQASPLKFVGKWHVNGGY